MRPRHAKLIALLATASTLTSAALAQPDATNAELKRLGLDAVLASRLELRFDETLADADEDATVQAAEALAEVYVRLLSNPESPIPVEHSRTRAQRLIDAVPGPATVGLRLTLAVARYASIETEAEKYRFGQLQPHQLPRVQHELVQLRAEFASTAKSLDTRIDTLERRQRGKKRTGQDYDTAALNDATRFRSLSNYYSAWSAYYLALLTGDDAHAHSAIEDFGRLLDSPDETPTLDRLPKAMLRHDPIARSALGVAMCYALLVQPDLSLTWIRTLRETPTWPEHLNQELDTRTAQILLSAARWTELREFLSRLDPKSNLSLADWQLCADKALTAVESRSLNRNRVQAAQQVARSVLHYFLSEGHLALVLKAAQDHPDLPLEGSGFAIKYVKGVEAYETAFRAHRAQGEKVTEPTASPQVATLYRAAARRLTAALQSSDATSFQQEQSACAHLAGQSLFAAGDLQEAAEMLERAYQLAPTPTDAEAPLWLAIAVLDRVTGPGEKAAGEHRNLLAKTYLERYDDTERAGLLLLRLVGQDLVDPEKAISILSEISPEAVYAQAANQYLATLLYTQWQRADSQRRPVLALQYLPLIASLIEADAAELESAGAQDPQRVARRLILSARRALDVAITSDPPIPDHAEQTLRRLTQLAAQGRLSLRAVEPEIEYRRLQIAMLSDDLEGADQTLDRLRVLAGPFADAAERLVYTNALERLAARPRDLAVLRRVIKTGAYVLEQLEKSTKSSSSTRATVMSAIADAAHTVWDISQDEPMRALALALDTKAFNADIAARPAMQRLASLAEQSLDHALAARAWLRLMATSRAPDPEWFSARANSIRLLAFTDPSRARAAIEQHRVLYPTLGPEGPAKMIRDAAASLDLQPDPQSPVAQPEQAEPSP